MLSIDWNLLFTIINLVIMYLLMRKFLFKPVMDIMDKRQELIDSQFNSAKEAEEKATELKEQWEDNISHIDVKKQQIIEEANERAKSEYGRIVSEANAEANKIIENAHRKIEADKDRTIREVEGQIAGIAMLAAAKIVNEKSSDLENKAMYDEFLSGKNQ